MGMAQQGRAGGYDSEWTTQRAGIRPPTHIAERGEHRVGEAARSDGQE